VEDFLGKWVLGAVVLDNASEAGLFSGEGVEVSAVPNTNYNIARLLPSLLLTKNI